MALRHLEPGIGRAGSRAPAGRSGRRRPAAAAAAWRSLATRLKTTPATSTSSRWRVKPSTSAAAEAPMPRASTTRITGRSNRLARSAVEPWPSAAPSNSPITPSPSTRSAPAHDRIAQAGQGLEAHRPAVQIEAGPAGGAGMEHRIEVVGADLERADREPLAAKARSSASVSMVLPLPEAGAATITPGCAHAGCLTGASPATDACRSRQ